MKSKKNRIQHQSQRTSENSAAELACELLDANKMLGIPVDPFALAALEAPQLKVIGADLKNRCDGQLEYHRSEDRFLLFFNNRYDQVYSGQGYHPRTRFSVAHELGHFYIDNHRAHLLRGGPSHPSSSEFYSMEQIEREADAFAAGLLMPSPLLRPIANSNPEGLSLDMIEDISGQFQTSLVSTAIRCVEHSDYPCEVVGIRDGRVAWRFRPQGKRDPLAEGGCYRAKNGPIASRNAKMRWEAFCEGDTERACLPGKPGDWFQVYGPATREITVWEEYLPVPIMATLVVLLTVPETELFDGEELETE